MSHTHDTTGHSSEHTPADHAHGPVPTKWVWRVFWILLIITIVEVGLATFVGKEFQLLLNVVFITLTIAKAFYIVSEFMHLGHEVKGLIFTILIPLLFVVWFVVAMLAEGDWWLESRQYFK